MSSLLESSMVLNIAHRGARSLAPENTMAAARKAHRIGTDLWEADVVVTGDQELILLHDDSLERTTNVTDVFPERSPWTVTLFTLKEIRRLDAGSWFVEKDPHRQIGAGEITDRDQAAYRGEKIPTLVEALEFTRDNDWRMNIELKDLPAPMTDFPIVERVLALIDSLNVAPEQIVLSSFNHGWLRQIRAWRPEFEIQATIGLSAVKPLDWGDLDFATYNARHTLIRSSKISQLAENGISVNVWAVNKENDMRRFIEAGAVGIITDFPQVLAPLLFKNES